jgi:hypothetical protein
MERRRRCKAGGWGEGAAGPRFVWGRRSTMGAAPRRRGFLTAQLRVRLGRVAVLVGRQVLQRLRGHGDGRGRARGRVHGRRLRRAPHHPAAARARAVGGAAHGGAGHGRAAHGGAGHGGAAHGGAVAGARRRPALRARAAHVGRRQRRRRRRRRGARLVAARRRHRRRAIRSGRRVARERAWRRQRQAALLQAADQKRAARERLLQTLHRAHVVVEQLLRGHLDQQRHLGQRLVVPGLRGGRPGRWGRR